jgi:hypothetical protein
VVPREGKVQKEKVIDRLDEKIIRIQQIIQENSQERIQNEIQNSLLNGRKDQKK